ncbi:MAG TPA: coenzyme F420-0:L-glutamate ligase, partial [Candidatus Cloacimonadota bacterium]|nr:coenzyme F420-0:L-glutamate ligase [Candidatus Cloacimonadota bacterium]
MSKNRQPNIEVNGIQYERIPVKTRILMPGDSFIDIIRESAGNILQKGDIISISESPMAITQGRAVPVSQLKIGLLARILWRCGERRYVRSAA